MRFHLCASCYAIFAAILAELNPTDLALIFICVFAVMAMELMNSAVERAVHKPDTTHWWSAGAAKDMAAGAVLMTALGALCVGACLLVPHLTLILGKLAAHPVWLVVLAASLVASYLFTFHYHNQKEKGEPNAKA